MATPVDHTTEDQVRNLVEKISAYVEQFHGGAVEFVSFDGNRLEVRLGGACLAGTVHQFFPDVQVVAAE